jgi:pilus assembly protein FimV
MINRTFSSVAVVIALGILTPIQANAFGLGKLELSSALNEPFKAKIPVTALREDEEGNLQVRLATSNEFARAGIERSHYLTKLVFNVVEHPGGAVIEVSSQQAIKEPFIDFLLTATTGEGRLIREYTVLLDPPKSVFVKPAAVVTPSRAKAPTQKSSSKSTYQYPDSGYQAPASNYYSGNSYGPTKRDDTLWDIALATKPSSSVSVHQMMMALRDKNPNAFINNNINNLKRGQTLTIPSMDEITKLSNRQAVARVAEQWQQWKDANNRVAATKAQAESNVTGSNDQLSESDGQADASSDARLQLVVDSDDATMGSDELSPLGSDDLTKLRDQLTLAQETIEGQEQENIDFKSRMDAMEEQLEIMRRIIMVKDADLARLQGALGDEEKVELASDDLSEEMQQALNETEAERMVDEAAVLAAAEAARAEAEYSSNEFLGEDSVSAVLPEQTDFDATTPISQDSLQAERMLDEAAVLAAAEAARAEAEYSGSNIFLGADSVSAVLPEQTDFDTTTPISQDSLQAERMLDEAAVLAAAEAAREEAELRGDYLFPEVGIDSSVQDIASPMDEMKDSFDEMSEPLDEMEEVLPYPEVDSAQELVIEDGGQLSLADKIKAFVLDNKTAVLGGLGALFLGLLAWLFARRRNQDEEYEWVDTESVEAPGASEVAESNVGASASDETEEVMNDDSSEVLVDPAEDIDDLLNQAEMSIAYGEYEEAHAVVERARIQEPTSPAVALKLIALAYHQKQPEKFNKLIADIDIDKDSAEWQEIVVWGKELAPENELLVQEEVEVTEDLVLTDDVTDTLTDLEPEIVDIAEENDDDSAIEFNLGESLEDTASDQVEEKIEDDQPLSFDTDFVLDTSDNENDSELDEPLSFEIETDGDTELAEEDDLLEEATEELVLDTVESPELSDEVDDLIEINLDEIEAPEELPELDIETNIEETEIEIAEVAEVAEVAEELDIGADDLEFDIGDFDEVDEAETKLDLAAAYVDMGDPNGAKNILNEVLQEGNDEQKSRAQDLLNNLK